MKKDKISTNEFINISDIKNDMLYTKNKMIFKYLKIEPVSIGMLEESEIKEFIKNLTSLFSSSQGKLEYITFFKLGKPVDISQIINNYNEAYKSTNNIKKRSLLRLASSYLHKHTAISTELENEYYMLIGSKNENNINEITEHYLSNLNSVNYVSAKIVKTEEIMRICNIFTNSDYSYIDSMDLEEQLSVL